MANWAAIDTCGIVTGIPKAKTVGIRPKSYGATERVGVDER